MTAAFLELWCVTARKDENFERYLTIEHSVPAQGLVQPYTDSPLDQEPTAENVYLNIINQARDYVYFMTPYLIITDELGRALGLAAKRGVDVRIITPGIPDKKAVYAVTRSYYAGLVQNGVRIFEYTPGFCHAKQCVCDGIIASIGTSNLDYRSLYHHFENNVLLYDCPVIRDIEKDFLDTFSMCREVTQAYQNPRSVVMRIWQCILRLFAPMM
jgi:cardiolipin synthase